MIKKGYRVLAVGLFLILLGCLLTACSQGTQQIPSHGQSPLSQPPAQEQEPGSDVPVLPTGGDIAWIADGTISDNEYGKTASYDGLDIFWASDREYIYVALRAQTTGWVSVAIQPGTTMKDADIILGFVEAGRATVIDHYSTGSFGPHRPDTELGGTDDIIEYAGSEYSGYTVLEFKRARVTGDSYDHPISTGENKIIWAYGSSDKVSVKHSRRGYGMLDL